MYVGTYGEPEPETSRDQLVSVITTSVVFWETAWCEENKVCPEGMDSPVSACSRQTARPGSL